MSSNGNKKLSDHPIIVILGLISACIAIFAFVTGFQSIRQIFDNITTGTGEIPKSAPFTPIPYAEPTAVEIISGTWKQIGLPSDTISDIEVVNKNVIYASTWRASHGIFKTNDGGKNWIAVNNGLGNLNIYEISFMGDNENTLIAGTDNGIWATYNGGESWQPIASEYPENSLAILSVASTTSSIYMAGQLNYGGYISRDFGGTWEEIEYQVNGDAIFWNVSIQHVATSLSPSPTIYLAGYNDIFRSSDDGQTWNRLANVGSNQNVADIIADAKNASIAYICTGKREVNHNGIRFFDKGTGIYKTSNGGGSWEPINNGLPNQGNDSECTKIAIDPQNSSSLFVAMNGQVYVSDNGGATWRQLSMLPDEISPITELVIFNQTACIGTNDLGIWCILLNS